MLSLAATLGEKCALLILDNCEHFIDDVARAVYEILQRCPNVTLLATSRERLNVSGEVLYRLPSLSSPSPHVTTIAEACEYSAIRLFIERAEALDAGMRFTDATTAATIDICRRLEGIPLAIELAVASLPSLGLRVLRDRLAESLRAAAPRRDMPQRQQTILATIAWSYELLSDSEREVFRALAIFAGGFTLEAAEAVCSSANLEETDLVRQLSALVDKSLVSVVHSDYGRTLCAVPNGCRAGLRLPVSMSLTQRSIRPRADVLQHVAYFRVSSDRRGKFVLGVERQFAASVHVRLK